MKRPSYNDLLRRSYAECNCAEAVAEYLRRLGQDEAARTMPLSHEAAAEALKVEQPLWERIGDDPQRLNEAGVVIISEGVGGELQAAVTVGGDLALTATRARGVHAVKLRGYRDLTVHGCYRWRGKP